MNEYEGIMCQRTKFYFHEEIGIIPINYTTFNNRKFELVDILNNSKIHQSIAKNKLAITFIDQIIEIYSRHK